MCKLTHDGWGAYAKGDGKEFRDFMSTNYPGKLDGISISRVEVSKRQDWSLEASEAMFPLVEPILKYLVKTLCLDPNVLRDTTLQRLELIHMEAYLHVNATMWIVCFEELRRLTNSNKVGIPPLTPCP